jgi:hypothetical protein
MEPRPPRYLVRAGVLFAFFLVLHLLGLRDHVSVLSGTEPASGLLGAGGLLYVAAWLVAVVAAPIFVIAAGLLAVSDRFRRGRARARAEST